jgi:hypothetical protein
MTTLGFIRANAGEVQAARGLIALKLGGVPGPQFKCPTNLQK